MQKIVLLALAVAMTCSGCSSYYNFRFDSDPEAAKVYCGGNYFGTTPFYMHADKDTIDKNISGSYLDTGTPCDVIWPSGAQAQTPRYVKVRGDDIIVIHAQRPKDHPNLEMDYQIGLKNKQLNKKKNNNKKKIKSHINLNGKKVAIMLKLPPVF